MAMSLIAIVKEILTSQAGQKLTLGELRALVEYDSEYTGKSKGLALEKQIKRILESKEFEQEKRGSCIYFGIKLGTIELGGKYDLSE